MTPSPAGKSFIHASKRKHHDTNFSEKRKERKGRKSTINSWVLSLFGLMFILALLPTNVSAVPTFGTVASISNAANAPNNLDADTEGSVVVLAHRTSGNLAIMEVSTDDGSNWVTLSTTVNVGAIGAADVRAIAISSTTYIYYYKTGSSIVQIRTTDSGATWFSSTILASNPAGTFDVDSISGTIVLSYAPSGGTTVNVLYSTNGGTSYATQTVATGQSNPQQPIIRMITVSAWKIMWLSVVATGELRESVTANAGTSYSTPTIVNDAFTTITPLPATPGSPVFQNTKYSSTGDAIFTCDGGACTTMYYARRDTISSTAWHFTNIGTGIGGGDNTIANCGTQLDGLYLAGSGTDRAKIMESVSGTTFTINTDLAGATMTAPLSSAIVLGNGNLHVFWPDSTGAVKYRRALGYCSTTPVPSGATATVAVTQLTGFDVDPTGQSVLVARVNNGANVKTFSPGLLGLLGSDNGVNCAVNTPAINALPGLVAYTDCLGSTPDVLDAHAIRLRNENLGAPDFLADCSSCQQDQSENGVNFDIPDSIVNLKSMALYPYDFSEIRSDCGDALCNPYHVIAIPFSEYNTGKFGIYVKKVFGSAGTGDDTTTRQSFSATGTSVDEICSWQRAATSTLTRRDYIAVAQQSIGLRVFTFSINPSPPPNTISTPPSVSISAYQTAPSFLLQAQTVGCANNLIMASTFNNHVGAYYLDNDDAGHTAGQTAWSVQTGIVTANHGLTLSPGGKYGAYANVAGTAFTIRVVNATTGAILTTITPPSTCTASDLVGLDMDRNANNLWLGCTSAIYRYSIFTATTGSENLDNNPNPFDPIGNNPSTNPSTTTTTSTSSTATGLPTGGGGFVVDPNAPNNFFGIDISYISGQWGIPEEGFRWLLGLFVTGLIVGGLTLGRDGGIAVLLGTVGVLIASGVCVAFGLFPIWFLLLEVLLVIVLAARLFFGSESNE